MNLAYWTVQSSEAVGKVTKNGHSCTLEGGHVRNGLNEINSQGYYGALHKTFDGSVR
jgi:hypothetical protein